MSSQSSTNKVIIAHINKQKGGCMKGNVRAIIGLLCISGIFSSIALFKVVTMVYSLVQPSTIICSFNGHLSIPTQNAIQTYIQQNRTILSSQSLINTLCDHFNCIKSAQLSLTPHGSHMVAHAHVPHAFINDTLIANDQGHLFSAHDFDVSSLHTIKKINIHNIHTSDKHLPHLIQQWIIATPLSLFESYSINWINEHNIECVDIHDPQFIIRCRHDQLITKEIIDQHAYIKNNYDNKQMNKRSKYIVTDIRFDKQIIISKK